MMQESRIVYGYTSRPFNSTINEQGKIDKGLLKVLFEEINGVLYPINSHEYFDDRAEVFIFDGFESTQDRYMQRLVKIVAVPNAQVEKDDNHTNFVTFKNKLSDIGKNTLISIIDCPLPDPINPFVSLPHPPRTSPFYLSHEGYVYGPFKLERSNSLEKELSLTTGKLVPLNGKTNNPSIPAGFINKFKFDDINEQLENSIHYVDGQHFLTDALAINKINRQQIEFTTPDVVISILNQMAEKRDISSQTVTTIKKKLSDVKLSDITKEAIKKVIDEAAQENKSWRDDLFNIIKSEESGKRLIDLSVSEQKEFYIQQWRADAEKIYADLTDKKASIESELESYQQERSKLQLIIEQKDREIEEKIARLGDQNGLEEELAKKRLDADKQLESKRAELAELENRYSDLKTIEELERKKDIARAMYYEEKKNIEQLEESKKSLLEELRKAEGELQRKLREMVPYITSIIQAPMPIQDDSYSLSTQEIHEHEKIKPQDLVYELVNGICNKFNKIYGRDYSPALISSILVALQQNFMTILSGPPGLGKTSFVRVLQNIIGLDDRFKEVAVGRTWTSEREFIGFYNSLNDNFSPAPNGVYQYLKGIEKDDAHKNTTHLMLLDEANLSPMEHYAAILLNVADTESSKTIPIGKGSIRLPSSLRIIGTVNHDMTTEPLSARLLDRSAVIPFDMDFDSDDINFSDVEAHICLSHHRYSELFGRESILNDDNISIEPIETLINVLNSTDRELGIPFIISKRKMEIVRCYVRTLTPVLQSACSLTYEPAAIRAYDYATLYFLLPPITGNGPGLEKRLNKLLNEAIELGLTKSVRKIEDMINRGKHHLDTFNYFNY